MSFTPKDWRNLPDETTPLSAEALENMEVRLSDYSDDAAQAAQAGVDALTIRVPFVNARTYGFLPTATAAANDTALTNALAAIIPNTDPATFTRVPTAALYIPAGQYKISAPFSLRSVMGFKLLTDGPKATVFDVQTSMEAAFDLNGLAHCTFQGFTVKTKGEGLDASVTVQKAVKLYWDNTVGSPTKASRSTTRNTFDAIDVANCRFVTGVQMGRDGDGNQCDTNQIHSLNVFGDAARGYGDVASGSPVVSNVSSIGGTFTNGYEIYGYGIPAGTTILSGGGTSTLTLSANVSIGFTMTHTSLWACPAGLFQDAVKLGSGVQGNNYGHQVGYCQAAMCRRGINFANAGGVIVTYDGLANQTDFYLASWTSMLSVLGGRSEHAQRMIDTPGSTGLSGPAKFANLMWDAQSLHGDRGWVQFSGGGSLTLEGISLFDLNATQPISPGLRITPNQVARQMTQISLKDCTGQVPLATLTNLIDTLRVNVLVEGYSEVDSGLLPVKHTVASDINMAVIKQAPLNIDHAEFAAYSTVDAKVTAAVGMLGSQGGQIYVPAGSRSATAPVTITRADVEIFGDGPNRTLWATQGNYDAFYWNTSAAARGTLRDMWIGTFAARASGYGVRVTGTSGTHIDRFRAANLTIQNMFNPMQTHYVDRLNTENLLFIQSIINATGGALFWLLGAVDVRIRDMVAYRTAGEFPSECLLLDSDCDTCMISGVETIGGTYGVRLRNSIGGASTGPRLIRLRDTCVESASSNGILIEAGRDVQIAGGHAAVNTGNGLAVTGGTLLTISGFTALQNGQHGFFLNGGLGHTSLVGCKASNNSQTTHNTYDGARVEDNQQHVTIANGQFGDSVFTVTNKQRYGVSIGSVNTDYIVVSNNDLSRNQTGPLGNFSTGANNNIALESIKPTGNAQQYVDADAGNDANDGKSWGTAKLTLAAARTAMPNGGRLFLNATAAEYQLTSQLDWGGYHIEGIARATGLSKSFALIRKKYNGNLFDFGAKGGFLRNLLLYEDDVTATRTGAAIAATSSTSAGGTIMCENLIISSADASHAWERLVVLDGSAWVANGIRKCEFMNCQFFGCRTAGETIKITRGVHVKFGGGTVDQAPTAVTQGIKLLDAGTTDVQFSNFELIGDLVTEAAGGCVFMGKFSGNITCAAGSAKNAFFIPQHGTSMTWTDSGSDNTLTGPSTYETVASAATVTIPRAGRVIMVTGTTSITSIVATGMQGHTITLIWNSATPGTLVNGSNLVLKGGTITPTQFQAVTLVSDGTNWYGPC